MNLDDLFAKRLAQLRNQKGVSARDMSLSLGQGAGYINNIENKNNLPSMTVFFYICTYLDVTPKEFFDFDNANPKELNSIISNLKKLSFNYFSFKYFTMYLSNTSSSVSISVSFMTSSIVRSSLFSSLMSRVILK